MAQYNTDQFSLLTLQPAVAVPFKRNQSMTLTQLKYIVALANEQHFGRAASHCCVSQSALSMAVKALEVELNLTLFERDRSGVRLTPSGHKVISKARLAVLHSNDIERLTASAKAPLSQPLNIGVCDTYAPYYLPRLSQPVKHRAPKTATTLTEGNANLLTHRLIAGELDVVIASYQVIAGAITRQLADEPLVAVLRQHDPLAFAAQLPLASLASERLWLPNGALRHDIISGCPQLLATVKTVADVNVGLHTLLQHISVEGGITLVPLSLANTARLAADGLVARMLDDDVTRKVALLWRVSFPRPQDIDALATDVITLCHQACWPQALGTPAALLVDNNCW